MSHTSTYKVKIKDVDLLCKTAEELSYQVTRGNHIVNLWSDNNVQAVASIKIDGWRFPIAITSEGNILYDHFGSKPNTMEKLGSLIQRYGLDLIRNNLPFDKIRYFDMVNKEDTGDFVLTLSY